jgi:hypothetical protein
MILRTTAFLITSLFCANLFAQNTSSSQISGTVRDATGSVIATAQVTVTQADTGLTRTAPSGTDGVYLLPSLPVGPYKLEVKKEGFNTYNQSGIVLQVGSSPTIDVTMQIGAVSQEINVEANATMVETNSSGVGQVVEQQRVVDLPLNGRLPTQLITLSGAAVVVPIANSGQLISQKNYPNEVSISVAGGPSNGLTYSLDGGTHNDPVNNAGLPLPFPDALQEFKVETSALQAQYGQHAGGAVNVITKSGSNAFHGDAFDFLRNRDFNARDFFAPTRDTLRRNQFGGTLGGPIKKNKLFFFAGYQGTIQKQDASSGFTFEPTARMLAGDFSIAASPACNANRAVTLKAPFVNNQIPQSLISPVAQKMMTFYPQPVNECGQVFYTTLNNFSEQFGIARIDYQANDKHTVFGRYLVSHALQPASYTGTPLSILNAAPDDLINSIVVGDTWVINPSTINNLRLTFDRAAINKPEVTVITAQDLGINITPPPIPDNIYVTVTGALYSAGANSFAAAIPTQSYQVADDFSLLRGAHQMQFGVNWIRQVQNATFLGTSGGSFNFTGQFTGLPMADFLLGQPATFGQSSVTIDSERHQYVSLYAQDSWRITSKLKINYGLRWEPYIAAALNYGHVSHFDPAGFAANVHSTVYPNAPAGVLYPGDAGFDTNNRPNSIRWNNFAPRVGMIYDPRGDGRMTIRASWGIFYDFPHTLFYDGYGGVPPWGPSVTIPTPAGGFANPWQGYPGGNPFPITLNKNVPFPQSGNYLTVPLNLHTTYLEQWNLSVQRQFGANWLASASYLGNNTIHMWAAVSEDPSVYIPGNCAAGQYGLTAAGPCSSLTNTNARKALTLINPSQGAFLNNVTNMDDGATAGYNAFLFSVQHRLARNFTIAANYTWQHCIADPVTTLLGGSYTNPNDRRFDRGNCGGIDIRQLFNLSGVVQSPKFTNRAVEMIAGNWQLAPIMGLHSGSPFTITTGVDNALNNVGGQRPNQLGSDAYCATKSVNCWLNPSPLVFAAPTAGAFGSSGANSLLGPAYFQIDLSLSRKFMLHENHSLEFRADVFNIENRANFSIPVTTLNATNFGRITSDITAPGSASGDPRIIQLSLKYAF